MSKVASLNELLNAVTKFEVRCHLEIIGAYEPNYHSDDDMIYRYESADFTELKINGVDPPAFLKQLKVLYRLSLTSIQEKLDSIDEINLKNRLLDNALTDINSALETISFRLPVVQINNQTDVKYIGQAEFRKRERKLFGVINKHITKTILTPLQTSLLKEQDLLPLMKPLVTMPKQSVVAGKYILSVSKINSLHGIMNGVVFDELPFPAFLMCFDTVNTPVPLLKYKYGYQNIMVYLLSKLNIDYADKFAASNFNIQGFRSLKSTDNARIPPLPKRKLRKLIDKILAGELV